MKIAISIKEDSEKARIDSRFGRCQFFAIFDTVSKEIEFIKNTATNTTACDSPIAIKTLMDRNVSKVISTEFGPKAQLALEEHNIEMVVLQDDNITLQEILKKIR
ncbi:MAG: hypothetical protein JEZ03_00110 [Bacteroidales bacterium]|nr:hypothetical protein [Bacteroidales bacterium]